MKKFPIALAAGLVVASRPVRNAAYTILKRTTTQAMIKRQVPQREAVYLTFDDGPHPLYTAQLLDLLQQYDAKATFFVVGERAAQYPHLIKRMHEEGHAIGIHHYAHRSAIFLTPDELNEQIHQTQAVLFQITGEQTTLYRPPWGQLQMGMDNIWPHPIVLWTRLFKDWKEQGHQLDELTQAYIHPGDILLLHDNGETKGADERAPIATLQAVKRLLETSTYSFDRLRSEEL